MGKEHGRGTYKQDGLIVYGHFQDGDLKYGVGEYPDGKKYQGQFKEYEFHGKGKTVYSCGTIHEGAYIQGKAHGFGVQKWTDGAIYEGQFRDGELHGDGVLTLYGKKFKQVYRHNQLVSWIEI